MGPAIYDYVADSIIRDPIIRQALYSEQEHTALAKNQNISKK